MRIARISVIPSLMLIMILIITLIGCAKQPLIWKNSSEMDLKKGGVVSVKANCEVPPVELSYLGQDIQQKVNSVLIGRQDVTDVYKIEILITKYDEGNAFARFMLIGLGQMHLHGTVEIKQGDPPVVIRTGEFKKRYCVGGFVGGMARMQTDVLPEVGNAIAEAIKEQQAVNMQNESDVRASN